MVDDADYIEMPQLHHTGRVKKRGCYGLISEEKNVGRAGSMEEEKENNINCVLEQEKTEEVYNVGLPLTIYKCTLNGQ